ncbi:hypothetical protein H7H82_04860 [Mycobacterium heidelbergense]|uniref:hypothetical protein n=1 Tax=Mycobacterium heidelbergense TaxID=53376 RepID=UPI001154C0C3|nr:hypothetical protein [Mycobacterium heidelbergense]MCV7049938.1 hypothetical protein [Mycobacterium heidelbergense]BBZ52416.1 hypothetical protein MHEI_41330 [Mycobacterium heidelbergense]
MDLAARPHITAGIALTSAAVLTAGPIAQHLPDLHVAQHLREVSVSNIALTDAADSIVDLFSGAESELASLASGAAAAAVPAAAASNIVNPIQTWINAFTTAGTNLQNIFNTFYKLPFAVAQQVAANWVSYADTYVGSYQTTAAAAIRYFTTPTGSGFQPLIQTALTDIQAGNISTAVTVLYQAFYEDPISLILTPLENILTIPTHITQELYNATHYLTTTGIATLGLVGLEFLPLQPVTALGTSLQAIDNAWTTGDPLGLLSNLVNTPGAVTNAFLNGATGSYGVLSNPIGLLNELANVMAPALAKAIVAPGAVNVATGGSLSGAFQGLVNQLTNGWPSLTPVVNDLSAGLTQLLQSIPSVVSNLPSILGNVAGAAGAFANQLGTLFINLLKLL